MAEYIEREAALSGYQTVCNGVECSRCPIRGNGSCKIEVYLRSVPAADVRPVVFCRDCKHRDPEDHKCDCGQLERAGCVFPVDDDYFCADGEKREES